MTRTEAAAYIAGLTTAEKRRLNELLKRIEADRRKETPA